MVFCFRAPSVSYFFPLNTCFWDPSISLYVLLESSSLPLIACVLYADIAFFLFTPQGRLSAEEHYKWCPHEPSRSCPLRHRTWVFWGEYPGGALFRGLIPGFNLLSSCLTVPAVHRVQVSLGLYQHLALFNFYIYNPIGVKWYLIVLIYISLITSGVECYSYTCLTFWLSPPSLSGLSPARLPGLSTDAPLLGRLPWLLPLTVLPASPLSLNPLQFLL